MQKYRFNPSRGGPAPGHIRDVFTDWLADGGPYADEYDEQENPVYVDADGESHSISRLIGLLWNCTDILPWDDCSELNLLRGSTYAQAVRMLRREYGF